MRKIEQLVAPTILGSQTEMVHGGLSDDSRTNHLKVTLIATDGRRFCDLKVFMRADSGGSLVIGRNIFVELWYLGSRDSGDQGHQGSALLQLDQVE